MMPGVYRPLPEAPPHLSGHLMSPSRPRSLPPSPACTRSGRLSLCTIRRAGHICGVCAVVMAMAGLFSGAWGAGFAPVVQVEYGGDGGDVPWRATVVVRFRFYIEDGCLHVCLGLFLCIWLLKNKAKSIRLENTVNPMC